MHNDTFDPYLYNDYQEICYTQTLASGRKITIKVKEKKNENKSIFRFERKR